MKKLIYVALSCCFILALAACTEEETVIADRDLGALAWEEDALCAVAYLGYEYGEFHVEAPETYLSDGDNFPVCEAGGMEVYLIIPRNEAVEGKVYGQHIGEEDVKQGELLYEIEDGEAFVLYCNESDIFSNVLIEMTLGEETISFSPFISLKDGSLILEDGVQNITNEAVS